MSDKRQAEQPTTGLALPDVYYVLFRQKWIVLVGCALGLIATVALSVLMPAQYQSEAQILIRYVTDVKGPTQVMGGDSFTKSPDERGANIINTEIAILTSLDLAGKVVSTIGADKILAKAGGGNDTNAAAMLIARNIIADPTTKGSVVPIIFQNPDPEIARSVLREIISAYIVKHGEMHQPIGVSGDFLNEETAHLRKELANTENELKDKKKKAGVISLDEAKKGWTEQISQIRQEVIAAGAELAEHRAMLGETNDNSSPKQSSASANAPISREVRVEYQGTCKLLDQLYEKLEINRRICPPASPLLQEVRDQIAETEKQKKKFETDYPALAITAPLPGPSSAGGSNTDLAAERLKVRALEARTNNLQSQLSQILAQAATVEELEVPIMDLQLRKETQEAKLKYLLNSLEQARIDGELGIGKGSEGIGVVSSPSPSIKKRSKGFKKLAAATLAGGVFGGIGLAFLIEMFLDHSVRRPVQIETKLGLPLFISIPDMSRNGHRRLARTSSSRALLLRNAELEPVTVENNLSLAKSEAAEVAPWDHRHALHRFYEGLRDRLLIYFEVRNLTHKPKLVAVTSCGRGAGVSSTAAGLAASLSETGDGNVLLVNMNSEQGGAQQFHKGQPGCPLDDALENETMSNALVKGKLYAATERLDEKLPRALPKSFAYLMPKLKASDYDYIIFDMPPVSQTSMTPRIAGLMDMVLLVIESEKTSQDVVKRVKALLGESKANVSTVLNKTRNYIPAQLHQEFLNDEV